MLQRAIGFLRGKITNAMSKAPPPPKPAAEMNVVEITEYNKIPTRITYDRWWLFTWFIMLPITIGTGVNAYFVESEHLSHDPPPYIPYEYLETQTRRYPWGDGTKSLFFNPKWNTIPGVGYIWRDDMAKWNEKEDARVAAKEAAEEEEEE